MELRPYQVDCVNQLRDGYRQGFRRQLLTSPTGSGKCFGAGTMVLMFDGTTRPIESIKVGQLVMGPDSRPRRVVSLARGREQLYRVVPKKGASYVVNASHVLSLKISGTDVATCGGVRFAPGQMANVTVGDYLSANLTFRHVAKGWRTGVEFMPKRIPPELPPYILGVWLGDGSSRTTEIYGIDHEVIREFQWFALSMGLSVHAVTDGVSCPSYRITSRKKTGRGVSLNVFKTALQKFDLILNKHVPTSYKCNSRSVRLEVLAGLMDTDGHLACGGFDFISKLERLADDVCFLARSVGLAAYVQKCSKTCCQTGATGTYYRVSISGNTSIIPCRVARKRAPVRKQTKDVLVVGVRLEPVGEGDYYGFELDGPDRLFLLWDFTVVHNTVLFSFITKSSAAKGQRTVIMAHRSEILRQISETLDTVGVPHKVLRAGMATPRLAQTVVASVNTLGRRLDGFPPPDLCIVDECFPAGTMVSTPTGEIPIEQIQPGSEVLSFDPSTERFSVQTVTATMQRKSPRMVDVRIAKKASFTCTANHPVLTISRGWISAERLTCDDMVLTIMPNEEVRDLWRAVSQQGLRPTGMQIGVQPEDDSEFVQKAWRPDNPIPKDEWNAPSGSQGTGLHEASGHGMEAADSRWQWTVSDVFSKADCLRSRLEYGGNCSDEDAESLWIPNVLQAGRGEHGYACWGGSRWRISPIHGSTDPGPEKRCVSRWARVEGVQVHQPAGGDGSGWVRVYNLEVTGPHTYIANGVVVHNCHHSAAGTWANVFGSWPTTRFLGVTATPERLDGKGLGDYYDRMVRGPEVEWLIANGFLSPPRYFAPARMIDASTIRKVAGEYAKNDAAKLFDKPTITGDAVIQYRKICPGKTAVAFAISIAHAVHVAAQFRGSGIPASVIDGTMTDEQRSQCIADLRARRILVLVSCELISEGFDLPAVEAVILLRPTASLALHLQQIGRGLRVSPGKTCIASGSLVLTQRGLVPIEQISSCHLLWDGHAFVHHGGLINRGIRKVITYAGLTATEDHLVKTREGWRTIGECASKQIAIVATGRGGQAIRECENRFRSDSQAWSSLEAAHIRSMPVRNLRPSGMDNVEQPARWENFWLSPLQSTEELSEVVLLQMPSHAGPVRKQEESQLQTLRWKGYPISIPVPSSSGILDKGESWYTGSCEQIAVGPYEQLRPLRAREHQMVYVYSKPITHAPVEALLSVSQIPNGSSGGSVCGQYTEAHAVNETYFRPDLGTLQRKVRETERQVWDIFACGPRNSFTCEGLLVHNCTYVLDHVGNCLRHGLAEEPRDWSLEGYAARKRKEEEAPLKTRRCEKCFAIFNGPVCPSCGAPYETKGREVENVAGDLKQLSPEKLEAIRARKGEERGCKSLEDFQKLGAARGYRNGWAMWRWKNSWRNKPTPA